MCDCSPPLGNRMGWKIINHSGGYPADIERMRSVDLIRFLANKRQNIDRAEVCHILRKKSISPFSSFSFPLFPSFSFCSSPFSFPLFPSFIFCSSMAHFPFFPRHQPPNHSILQNIYPYNVCFYWCIFQDIRRPLQTTLSVRSSVKPIPI